MKYLQTKLSISQHKNVEERCAAAKMVASLVPSELVPVLADSYDNEALTAYGAWPERLYILRNEKVAYIGGTGPDDYNLQEMRKWLEDYKSSARL